MRLGASVRQNARTARPFGFQRITISCQYDSRHFRTCVAHAMVYPHSAMPRSSYGPQEGGHRTHPGWTFQRWTASQPGANSSSITSPGKANTKAGIAIRRSAPVTPRRTGILSETVEHPSPKQTRQAYIYGFGFCKFVNTDIVCALLVSLQSIATPFLSVAKHVEKT